MENKTIYFSPVLSLGTGVISGSVLHTIVVGESGKEYFVVDVDDRDEPIIIYEDQVLNERDYNLYKKIEDKKIQVEQIKEEIKAMENERNRRT